MRLVQQIIDDLADVESKKKALEVKAQALILELAEIHKFAGEQLTKLKTS